MTSLRKTPFPPNLPRCPPGAGWPPGESGHTHTTRRQIIQDTILQPQVPREPPRKAPYETLTRAWSGEICGGAGARRALGLPLAEADPPAGRGGRAPRSHSEPEGALLRNARGPAVTATTRTSSRGEPGARPPAGRGPRRVWVASLVRASGSLGRRRPQPLGAEFATHLKVARNRDLPNPRPPRTAQARSGPKGRGEVRGRGLHFKGR